MINNIKLENIKCFENVNIALSNLNILTGINGSGKSTIIQSILLIAQSAGNKPLSLNGELVELGNYSDLLYDVATNDETHIFVDIDENSYGWGYQGKEELKDKESIFQLPHITGELELLTQFDHYNYISAERWGPRNNVSLNTSSKDPFWLGKHGEYTVPVLGELSERKGEGKLQLQDPRKYEEQASDLTLDNIISWMGEISPNVFIDATLVREAVTAYSSFRFSGSRSYKAINVGFGLSYALSVITALMVSQRGSLVIIENPEAHLHPRGQSRLGQLIGLTAKAGVQVVIETHSEHIINGTRILARKDILPPSEINILYFQRDQKEKKSKYKKLNVNDMGQLSEWPDGFFDQQAIDMKTLMTGE